MSRDTVDGAPRRWSQSPCEGHCWGRNGTEGWPRLGKDCAQWVSPTQGNLSSFSEHSGLCVCARDTVPGC